MNGEWLDIQAVMERYQLRPGGVYQQRAEGRAPGSLSVKIGRRLLWSTAVLERWEAAGASPDWQPNGQ